MALTKSTTIYGLSAPEAYYNINNVGVIGESTDAGKVYNVTVLVNEYTDSTKENHVSQKGYELKGLTEAELTIATYYAKLKELEEFTGATDV